MAINPLQAPISYAVDVKSPFEAALGGIKIGAGLEELEVARQKRALEAQQLQAAQAQQQQYQAGLNAFFAKPPADRRIEELQPLLVGANKQQFDALKLIGENMGAEKLASFKRFTSQVLLALESNPETAKTILQERIDVEADPNQKRAFQDILTIAKQNPEQASRLVESLGAGTFGEEWYKGITAVRTERRTAGEAPAKLRQSLAAAQEAEAKSKVAAETADNDIEKAKFQRQYEEAKARREQAEADLAAGTVKSRIAKAELEAKPAPGFAIIPEAERVSLGLPAGVYQRNLGTQKIEPVSKELVRIDLGQKTDELMLEKLDIPRVQEFSSSATSARSFARDAKVIADLLKGKGGGTAIKVGTDFAKSLGFTGDTIVANDLANSLAVRGATQLRPPGSGSTSDIEFKAFVSAFPSLANSEGGRELMAKYAEAFATRSARLADYARQLLRDKRFSEEEMGRYDTSLGPILRDDFYKRPGTGAPVTITLPNGQRATFPNQQAADAFKQRAGIQ